MNDLSKDTSNGQALGTVTLEKKPEVKEPPLFQVVLLNDDYTPNGVCCLCNTKNFWL